jgi:hypothetical protein
MAAESGANLLHCIISAPGTTPTFLNVRHPVAIGCKADS